MERRAAQNGPLTDMAAGLYGAKSNTFGRGSVLTCSGYAAYVIGTTLPQTTRETAPCHARS
eukprot:1890204-Rhodomonas_salina.2